MQEVTAYQCDYCKYKFSTIAECKECEQSHIAVDTLNIKAVYSYITAYPTFLNVSFSDGKSITYERVE